MHSGHRNECTKHFQDLQTLRFFVQSSVESSNWTAGLFLVLAMYYAEQLLFYYLPGEIVAQEVSNKIIYDFSVDWKISFKVIRLKM